MTACGATSVAWITPRDTNISRPEITKGLRHAKFAGNVHLPCDAARIPAAQYGLTCPAHVDQPLARRANWHVICTTHNPKQAAMWISTTLDIGTVHISGEAIFR